ncbi:carboxypeptidase-like regulatory domain-containing protein [Botrimarina sp.]|uniref:carboxypeptidase-like regulatory domain-containing protein n=1 Tax=Botrimarina sp. TaxID=2795802 RepID=UPI0032EAFFB2
MTSPARFAPPRHAGSKAAARPATLAGAAGLLALVAAGCGDSRSVAPVSGVVTLDGAPLAGARVNTQPISPTDAPDAGVGSFAVTDDTGHYELELVSPPRPGAVVGTHVVRIKKLNDRYVAGREDAPLRGPSQLPAEAFDGSLRLTVPAEGTDQADFALESGRRP